MTNTLPKTDQEAKNTVNLIYEGKQLLKYIPKGQSPKLYIDLIKSQVMKPDKFGNTRSDSDLLLFLYVAKRTGLDPLTKQIYAVFRWDSRQAKEIMSIQAGIDGMRLVAQRTGQYAGQDDAIVTPEDESTKYPTKATVTVYKSINGERVAFTASARWGEYAPVTKDGNVEFMWAKMPYTMLAKCAEALSLRKGFPNELSGIYSQEEMKQTTPEQEIDKLPTPDKFIDKTIIVDHGAPDDNSLIVNTPPEYEAKSNLLAGTPLTPPEKPAEILKDIAPDFANMRNALKPELGRSKLTIEEMQKRLKKMHNSSD